ncbi:MAG: hypothetical protein J6X86_07130 [Bacteroidales bacterium]|nr:hypothetical protein [Bacteroidales bacterium]
MKVFQTLGNKALWQREKTLFLTSRMAPIGCYGKVFLWVEDFDKFNGCAVCFNTSELEEEVLKALLVCHVPTTLVVTGRFHDTYNVQIEQALKENRLLILVLQREESDKGYTARLRNQYIINQVQHIACGYINPNGSIFGLLAGLNNITHLLDKEDIRMAAEQEAKPYRWTVAEDKRLLRMFYEDMGVHAIHKAINRPYSTIYKRIKALTMNDEVLKGREFEDYVIDLFDLPNNKKLTLKEWRGDKSLPGVYPESNSAPDFVFEYAGKPFAVECKWRSHLSKDIEKELLPPERMASFHQFSTDRRMVVYLLLGIGGLPNDPDCLYFTCIDKEFSLETLSNSDISSKECLLEKIESLFATTTPTNYMERQKALYYNAYKPWSNGDDELLTKLYTEGTSIKELMTLFQRNRGSITSRLRKLGLTR